MFKRRHEYGSFNLMQVITLSPTHMQVTRKCINQIYLHCRTLMIVQKENILTLVEMV